MSASRRRRRGSDRLVPAACALGGVLLAAIGLRYLLASRSAALAFGVVDPPRGYELHYVIGLRNVWLGLLAIGLTLLRQWRALVLWLALATVVCFGDAAIAAASSGKSGPIAFHLVCGIACLALALALGRQQRQGRS
jgi:hypothetical protein